MSASHRHPSPPALAVAALLALAALAAPPLAAADEIVRRHETSAEVSWRAPTSASDPVKVRLLAINDLHGHLQPRAQAEGAGGRSRPMGGAAVLASYLATAREWNPRRTLTLVAGDSIGASALVSGLLRDEPTMAFLDLLADGDCPRLRREWAGRPAPVVTRCRTLATVGNHEFDKGTAELERLLYGGRHPEGPVLGRHWQGSKLPWIASNVVRRDGRRSLLPGSAIVDLDGVQLGVIGAVTLATPALVPPARISDIQFLPEAPAINAELAKLKQAGVHAVVLLIHEGLQRPRTPQTFPLAPDEIEGALADVLRGLDPGIDVVVSGHSHHVTNLLLARRGGAPLLVVQARSAGTAYAEIDLTVDRAGGGATAKSARILTTWGDAGPGLRPVKPVERLVAAAEKATAPIENRQVGVAAEPIARRETPAGESALGNLIADAQRAAAGTDFAFMNAGGVRSDLPEGPITFGRLFAVQPFGNTLMRLTLTGEQILRLLEQQWSGPNAGNPQLLRPSGLRYVYDPRRPPGRRVVEARDATGAPLDPARRYSVAANDFIVGGGDNFTVFAEAAAPEPLMLDIEAFERLIARSDGPVRGRLDGRLVRLDAPRD